MKNTLIFTKMIIVSSLLICHVTTATTSTCIKFYDISSNFSNDGFSKQTSQIDKNILAPFIAGSKTETISLTIKNLQTTKPGDLVSYTVRNPYGNDPNYLQPEVGVFERLDNDGKTAVISGRLNNIVQHLVGAVTVIKPGDLVSYTVRNPYGNDPNYLQPEVGVFERLDNDGKTAVISGRLNNIVQHLVGGIKILKSADSGH